MTFDIDELKLIAEGGRGLMLIGRSAKDREETLEIRSLNNARTARAITGKVADLGLKPIGVVRVERVE